MRTPMLVGVAAGTLDNSRVLLLVLNVTNVDEKNILQRSAALIPGNPRYAAMSKKALMKMMTCSLLHYSMIGLEPKIGKHPSKSMVKKYRSK